MRAWLALALAAGCSGQAPGTTTDGNPGGGDGNPGGGDGNGQSADAAPMVCGDGIRVRGEQCDDHNTVSGDGCDATCNVEPYAGAPQSAIDALHAMNALRAQADEPGSQIDTYLVMSSQNHATYYATNAAPYTGTNAISPHEEASGYPGFTGINFYDRMTAAGFTGPAMSETMAFVADPQSAVSGWLNTVFHRIPMLHPNMTRFGYGNSTTNGRNNDVADYSSGTAESASMVIVWPPPGATGVPRSFNTAQEGPTPPPAPGNSTTTGPIVSVYFANSNGTITSHSIKDSTGTTLADTMIAKDDMTFGAFMMGSYCFYAAGPAASGATFTVAVAGTVNGQPFTRTWTFTTQ